MTPLSVLLVDDNPDHRFLTRRAARSLEGELALAVDTAQDGEEALAKIRAAPPGLVMLDIKMPRLDGFEVLEALSVEPWRASLAVVVFTSSENGGDVARAAKLGADDYVTKPMDAKEFASVVRATIQRWAPIARTRQASDSRT